MKYLRIFLVGVLMFGMVPAVAGEADQVAGGVSFETPDVWVSEVPSSSMRTFQFQIPGPEGEEAGEMTVFYFGPGQGGAVEANLERWKGQFTPSRPDFVPEVKKLNVNGIKVTTIYLEGTYNTGMMMRSAGPKSGFAALGAIVEGRQGPVFFKIIGPEKTIQNTKGDFETFVESFRAA